VSEQQAAYLGFGTEASTQIPAVWYQQNYCAIDRTNEQISKMSGTILTSFSLEAH
jgi:hypothetical protein